MKWEELGAEPTGEPNAYVLRAKHWSLWVRLGESGWLCYANEIGFESRFLEATDHKAAKREAVRALVRYTRAVAAPAEVAMELHGKMTVAEAEAAAKKSDKDGEVKRRR